MANNIGYEKLRPSGTVVGPTASIVQGGVASAIFYLDPRASSAVRWRSDRTSPSRDSGVPLLPGGAFALAGEGNIRNARFVSESGAIVDLHASYFDRVDVLAIQFSPNGTSAELDSLNGINTRLDEVAYLLKQIRNAAGSMAFDTMGDGVPADDK